MSADEGVAEGYSSTGCGALLSFNWSIRTMHTAAKNRAMVLCSRRGA
jgi:hypothetical protein